MTDARADEPLVIPPPREDRQPLRSNLLNALQKCGSELSPLFPYMHAGAMVPAGSVFIGGPDANYGHFFHGNTVDEVIIAVVAKDATLQTGQVYVGGRSHGVNSFLKDEKKPGAYAVFSVTQRQVEQGEQRESLVVMCPNCREQLWRFEYDATPVEDAHELEHPFPAHRGSLDAMEAFNERGRVCEKCGHESELFPNDVWGWKRYATQAELMVEAREALLERADEATRS